jgi:hypothetical protein
VQATLSDKKLGILQDESSTFAGYEADLLSAVDYYPFGMQMPGRNLGTDSYRYGMNTQEKDDEIYGQGNTYSAEFWEYDARLGRRWNVDPKPNPSSSQYNCFAGNPIWFSDFEGDTITIDLFDPKKDGAIYHDVAKSAVSKQINDGIFLVYAHSHSGGIQYTDKNGNILQATDAETFNLIMSEKCPEYKQALKDGKEILLKLYTCNAAAKEYITENNWLIKRENTIAEMISASLPANSTLVAADGYVVYGIRNGKPVIKGVKQTSEEQPNNTNNGGFVTIKNGKIIYKQIMSYDSKTGITKKGEKKKIRVK